MHQKYEHVTQVLTDHLACVSENKYRASSIRNGQKK